MKASEALARYGSKSAAARALGIARQSFQGRLASEARKMRSADNNLHFPKIPDHREPIGKLIERRTEHYKRLRAHKDASTWQQIVVDDDGPIAIALMGDPHVDDDGCNWPKLQEDVATIANTPGMYGLNIGDQTNNWVGRLARLFGNQETSQTSARQLAEWLLTGSAIRWLAVILGNHDEWNEGGEIIRRMCDASPVAIPVHEWAAKLELIFPNKATCRISAAHDFRGRSIYNATHGLKREAIWNQEGAHLLVAGHIHYGEIGQCELPGGANPWLVRVRGYKELDGHALVNGYHEGERFASVVAIIDPHAPEWGRVTVIPDVQQGAAVLTAMRAIRAKQKAKANGAKSKGKSGKSQRASGRRLSTADARRRGGRKRQQANRGRSVAPSRPARRRPGSR